MRLIYWCENQDWPHPQEPLLLEASLQAFDALVNFLVASFESFLTGEWRLKAFSQPFVLLSQRFEIQPLSFELFLFRGEDVLDVLQLSPADN
jgi:hypothetical protein